ncbi:ATP-dependent DNA helicase [Trichonephila clavipes]|nr:ATP-dependent DNA helicase [Trichonephila clavipes]
MAAEVMDDNTQVDYRIKISGKAPLKRHKGRFNAPSVSEVAIMIAGELRNRKAPCIVDGKCSKRFPRQMLQETQTGDDGYPCTVAENQMMVAMLSLNLQSTHKCGVLGNSVKSIKYICKYVTKGSDAAMFAVANEMLNRLDEVTTYQQGRYISSSEAVWRLLNFPIHQRYPTVVHFWQYILKGGQRVYYEPGQPTAHLTDTPKELH